MASNNWTDEQKAAIDFRGNNLLVSASAGSGKTAVLVERIIKKVIEENAEVDKLLVVTFTKAAAGELKERLQKALKSALDKDPKNQHLRRQLRSITQASITTIHSFCLDVIRSNFYKIGLDPNFSICDETKSKLLKTQAINDVLELKYTEKNSEKIGFYEVLQLFNMDEEDFTSCIVKIWDDINCKVSGEEYLEEIVEVYNVSDDEKDLYLTDFGKEIVNDIISNLNIALNKALLFREKLEKENDEFLRHIEVLDDDIFILKQIVSMQNITWDRAYEVLLGASFRQAPRVKVQNEALKEEFSSFRKDIIKKEIEKAKNNIYAPSKDINISLKKMYPYLRYIFSFILDVNKRYASLKNDENLIDFNDIEHYALDILLEKDEKGNLAPSLEAKRYIDKFDEIYIDEYQDTSYIQEAILESIAKIKPGNRFMVGDIKQSIYRFRHAAVDIFVEKYMSYSDFEKGQEKNSEVSGRKIILAKNFRSRKEVLDGINYIFERVMSESLGNCDYSLKEVLTLGNDKYIYDKDSYKFEVNLLDFDDTVQKEESELDEYIIQLKKTEHEALYIASRVNKLVNVDKFQVMDKDTGMLRDVRYSDICILLRSLKDKSEIYEKALKSISIPVYSSSSVNLWDNDEVNLVLSFLKVIDNPMQDIEMVSIMYSVLGNFTLDEIYSIRSLDFSKNIYDTLISFDYDKCENSVLKEKIARFVKVIEKYRDLSSTVKISEIISSIYEETNLYNYTLLLENPLSRKINLDSLITVANSVGDQFTTSEFIAYIDSLKNSSVSSPDTLSTSGESEDALKIMTIHASKGLEFPIVILANTDKKYSLKDLKDKAIIGKHGIGIDYIDEDYKITYPTVIKEAIKQEVINENKSEELRMLYVALTRAREKLITYIPVNNLDKKLESIFILKKDEVKIDSSICKTANSYADIFLLSLKDYLTKPGEKQKDIYDINHYLIHSAETASIYSDYGKLKNISIPKMLIENKELRKNLDVAKIEETKDKIKEKINYQYSFLDETKLMRRVGVSLLKKSVHEDEYEYESNDYIQNTIFKEDSKFKIPKSAEEKITGARRGTVMHFILENIDYNKVLSEDDLKEYILELEKNGKITEEERKSVNINLISKFLSSPIAFKIRESKYIKKEAEFVLNTSKYTKSSIQGVIDLYFESKEGEIYLLDFKTDNLEDEQQFIDRYKVQLDIYKEALENILEKEVKNVYIYSFKLGREIKINT